eukprot:4334637-Prymnesium_polylepis.1
MLVRQAPQNATRPCLWPRQAPADDWSVAIVIAAFSELGVRLPLRPPAHLLRQAPVVLYQRLDSTQQCYLRNKGYEVGVYLRYLLDYYDQLPSHTAFIQADWLAKHKGGPAVETHLWQVDCLRRAAPRALPAPAVDGRHLQGRGTAMARHAATPAGRAAPGWHHWMPLGIRHHLWPPLQVVRTAEYFRLRNTDHVLPSCSGAHGLLVEWCWRELAAIFGIRLFPKDGPGAERFGHRLNVTFCARSPSNPSAKDATDAPLLLKQPVRPTASANPLPGNDGRVWP